VSELPQFQSSFRGLRSWTTVILSGGTPLDSSFDLAAEIDSNPQLLAAAIGDGPVVLTPCVLPPSRQSVQRWLTCRGVDKKETQDGRNEVNTTDVSCVSDDNVFTETPKTGDTSTEVFGSSTKGQCHIASTLSFRQTPAKETLMPWSIVTSTPVTRQGSQNELASLSQTLIGDAPYGVIGCTPDDPTSTNLDLVASTPVRKPSLVHEDLPTCTPIAKVMSQEEGDGGGEVACTPPAPPGGEMGGRRRRCLLRETESHRGGPRLSTRLKVRPCVRS